MKIPKMEKIILKLLEEAIILFFLFLIFFICIVTILLIFSEIEININNIRFTSNKVKGRHLKENYEVEIKIYILKLIKILNIQITKSKLEKLKLESKLKDIENKLLRKNIKVDINILETIKQLNLIIKNLDLKVEIGTENAATTSIIFAVISSVIPIILRNKIKDIEKQKINIIPVYTNENLLNIQLDCIFNVKMIHIIYIIYILSKKRRDEKNVRTSNRRSYGYSHE